MSDGSITFNVNLLVEQAGPPSNPPSGKLKLWAKTDNTLHILNSSGVDAALPSTGNYTDLEVPSGSIGGGNVAFTLAHTPNPAASCVGYVRQGGAGAFLPMIYGIDFTLAGANITTTTAPDASSNLYFSYRY